MKAKKSVIPPYSLTRKYLPADYSDAFAIEAETDAALSPDDIMIAFWTGQARWVRRLFRLRHFLVQFVGLKGSKGFDPDKFREAIRNGGSYGFASVAVKNDRETVLLLSDSHLDAYLSTHIAVGETSETVTAVTLVHFKNRLGRVYFFVIRPFHNLIVKSVLKRAVNKITH